MANRITYSCNSPDGGSDMDVSDSDEGEQIYPQSIQQKTKPHQGMVISLHNYMQKDSWRENSIGVRAENKLELKKQPYDAASYASIAHQQNSIAKAEEKDSSAKAAEEDSDSDSSFHTAPNSPESDVQDIEPDVQDIEPGQITEPVYLQQDQLQLECEALDKALKENAEREVALDQEIKRYRELQETIRIQLLELKVRNSIAKNRKPTRAVDEVFSVSNDTAINESTNGKVDLLELSTEQNALSSTEPTGLDPSSSPKGKGKSRANFVGGQPVAEVRKDELPTDVYSPFLQPIPKSNPKRSKKKATGANAVPKGPLILPDDTVEPLTPPTKRAVDVTEEGSKKKRVCNLPVEYGNRLIDAVIDKPFSKRYMLEVKDRPEMNSDIESTETKRERKAREREEMISDSERIMIATDEPGYPGYCIPGRKELSRNAFKAVQEFLSNNSLSLKEMRLILLNLKEASIKQDGRLTIEQEEFVKALIRKILHTIEAYMTLNDEAYSRSLRKQQPPPDVNPTLPDHYYGNIETLDFNRPDLGHHELYKVITYFGTIINTSAKRKAQQFLLRSGRVPNQPILRTCDPSVRDDADATLSQDETDYARQIKALKRERLEKNKAQHEKGERKKEKRRHTATMKRERSEANKEVASGIDQMAEQIAMNIHMNKKIKYEPDTTDVDVPTDSKMAAAPQITSWKPKPENDTVHTHQFIDPSRLRSSNASNVAAVEPIEAAVKEMCTTLTKYASIVDDNTKKPTSSVVDTNNKVKRNSPVNQEPITNAPIIIIDDSPLPNPVAEAPVYNETNIKATNTPIIMNDNLTSDPTVVNTHSSNEDTSLKSQENSMQFQPYKSALNSLGLAHTTPLPEPKSASLCSAESSGGVCKVRNCNFTHFSDYL